MNGDIRWRNLIIIIKIVFNLKYVLDTVVNFFRYFTDGYDHYQIKKKFISQFFVDRFADSYKKLRPSVRVADWSVAKKKDLKLKGETIDEAVDSENSVGGDRDVSGASYGKHEGKKGRSGPGELVGEAVSNEVAIMLVDDALEFLSEAE